MEIPQESAQSTQEKKHVIWNGPDLDSGNSHSEVSDSVGDALDQEIGISSERHARCPILIEEVLVHDPMLQSSRPSTLAWLESSVPHRSCDRIERADLSQSNVQQQQRIDVEQEVVLGPSMPDEDFLESSGESDDAAQNFRLQPHELAPGACGREDALAQSYKMFQFGSSGYPIPVDSMEHANGHLNAGMSVAQGHGYPHRVNGRDQYSPHQQEKRSQRPCKGKRDRYRKLVLRIQQAIDEDPEGFDLEATELPPSIASNKKLKQKLQKRVQAYTSNIRSERQEGVPAHVTVGHSHQRMGVGQFDSDYTKPFQYYASEQLFHLPHRPGMLCGPVDASMLPMAVNVPTMPDDHLAPPMRLFF